MFLQIIVHGLAHSLLYGRTHFHVTQLGLGLTFELWLGHLHAHHGGESFLEVLGLDVVGKLGLLEHLLLVAVLLQGATQCRAETVEVCTTLIGVDIVHKAVNGLRITRVVGQGNFDGHTVAFGNKVNDVRNQWGAALVHPLHEFLQALGTVEHLETGLAIGLNGLRTQVGERKMDARIQVAKVTQTLSQTIPFEHSFGENRVIGMEGDGRAGIFRVANDLHTRHRLAESILLTIDVSLAMNLGNKVVRQCIDAAHAHAMKTTGNLVGVLVKLATSVQHGHNDLKGRTLLLLMHVHRNASSVIDHLDGVTGKDIDLDVVAIAGQGFIDTVIDHLAHEVMQTLHAGIANIHGRTLAHGFQTFEDLDVTGVIVVLNL